MPKRYDPKGPTVRRQYACPCCGHWQSGASHFQARPIAYREVEYAGRGRIRVVETVFVDQLAQDELLDELRVVVTRLADRLGVMPPAVVREVVREVVRHRIPEAFKRRAAEWQKAAEKWARHERNRGRRRGRDFTLRARRTRDAGSFVESWTGDEFTARGRRVVDEGNSTERW